MLPVYSNMAHIHQGQIIDVLVKNEHELWFLHASLCVCDWACIYVFVGTKSWKFTILVGTNTPYGDQNPGPH